jgi:8-oxo-dGTP pyrophosphatase MutT (NUDIX family)
MSTADTLPEWLRPVAALADRVLPHELGRFLPPAEGGRRSAVLILFGEGEAGPDILLTERSHGMRSHPGQVSFPGGAIDATDADAPAAAVREAVEETGLDPAGVAVFATLPDLFLPPSGFVVSPVLAWWRAPSPVSVVDPREVASVHRVPLAELLNPDNRLLVRHPSGFTGPAFQVRGLLVWGFTAGLLDRVLRLAGWEKPWAEDRLEEMPPENLGFIP